MALVDVSELLSDPDFVDTIQIITRYPIVNSMGENVIHESIETSIGSVQPADYKTVKKQPEAMQVESLYSFFFKGKIVASAPGEYSSVLVFKNMRYQVRTVEDFSNWGAGYTNGVCVAQVPA